MWTVYLKEILELLRDRKTLIFTVVIPIVIIPLLFAGFALLQASLTKQAQQAELAYAMIGQQYAPALSQRFAGNPAFREFKLSGADAIAAAIANETIKFALVIPPDFGDAVAGHQQTAVTLHFNSAADGEITRNRVAAIVDTYNVTLQEAALPALGVDASRLPFLVRPVRLDERSTANLRERFGAIAGGLLPYVLLIVCLMAAMYPAIDLGAGEKERGTLETLLLAPIPRRDLVLAKFLVLFTVGLTSTLLMVMSIGLLLGLLGTRMSADLATIANSLHTGDLVMVVLMLSPPAAIFSSVLLAMSIHAKSYKEANGMMQPMAIVVMLPLMLATAPGVTLNWFWAMVPLTNVALAMKELVKGTLDYRMFAVILLSTSLLAGALLAWCCRFFNREEVLFRS